jgi:hypothetical protein
MDFERFICRAVKGTNAAFHVSAQADHLTGQKNAPPGTKALLYCRKSRAAPVYRRRDALRFPALRPLRGHTQVPPYKNSSFLTATRYHRAAAGSGAPFRFIPHRKLPPDKAPGPEPWARPSGGRRWPAVPPVWSAAPYPARPLPGCPPDSAPCPVRILWRRW